MDNFLASIPEEFWKIIEDARQDPDRLRGRLKQMSREELVDFAWTYEGLANELRADIYWDFVEPDTSEDTLAELANWVVAQGRKLYEEVWKDPEELPAPHDDPGLLLEAIREHEERYDDDIPLNEQEWDPDWRGHGKRSPWR